MQAVILAAGMGSRLKQLTKHATKCMVEVNGVSMISRMLHQLESRYLSKIVIVVGYEADKLKAYIESLEIQTPVIFIQNDIYDTTNNIYSLYLAKEYMVEEDTILLESDLIFEDHALSRLIDDPYPSLMLVAKFQSWMDGTVVTLDEENYIIAMYDKKHFRFEDVDMYFKTVNIYKFSKKFMSEQYMPFLEAYCKALGYNEYYEQVLKLVIKLDKNELKAACLEDEKWYETDDIQDLHIAETIFAEDADKSERMQKAEGGYWRYPTLQDFSNLSNPYFPPQKLLSEMKANMDKLICSKPSGQRMNGLLAAKYYGVSVDNICMADGIEELTDLYREYAKKEGKEEPDLYIQNPDALTGEYMPQKDILQLAMQCKAKKSRLILDETFVDFAEEGETFLTEELLEEYPEVVVLKSISQSYGIPGMPISVLASGDKKLLQDMKQRLNNWKAHAMNEFFLQIFEKYNKDYKSALQRFRTSRNLLWEELNAIKGITALPSQANFIICKVEKDAFGMDSSELCERLLCKREILIKDLSIQKEWQGKSYVRVGVCTEEENDKLVKAMRYVEAGNC